MTMLIAGLLIWSILHFLPAMQSPLRTTLIDRIGGKPYRGLFALGIAGSIVLMVFGWQSTPTTVVYTPPEIGKMVTSLLLLAAFILLGAAKSKSSIRHHVRHPMLAGVLLWSIGHLASNGDVRSVILFSTMGIWSVIMINLINRRDGEWEKPEKIPFKGEIKGLLISLLVFLAFVALHPYFTGVSPAPH